MGDLRRLIAFDLDGTLVDSRRDLADSANELIAELGGRPLSEDAVGRLVGEGAQLLVARALRAAGLEHDAAAVLPRFLDIYDLRLLNHTRPYDGMLDLLRMARGHARLAVLTNKPKGPSERILEALGLREFFDDVVGGDGPLPRKPDPAGLTALMARAGTAADATLMIGDSVIDYDAALRAKVRCVMAAYGYGFTMFPPERLTGDLTIARSTAELGDAIQRLMRDTA